MTHRAEFFVGISYMAFRLAHLVREVQNEVVPMPTLAEYVAYALFVPILSIGPIQHYSAMASSLAKPPSSPKLVGSAWMRILVGFTKYLFLATILNQFTYSGLLLDGHPHHLLDLFIAVPAYTLYLYCNFSGFCDMVIGTSALLGIEVGENFDRPFASRNLQEFWNHWHITLSAWFRDMMFTPMLKALVRLSGPKSANHMIALTLMIVFITVGVWHGTGLNYLLFGMCQGIGLVVVHYYRLLLRSRLSRQSYAAYQESPVIHAVAVAATFVYFSLTLFFFANTMDDIRRIAHVLV
jgi:D-alanyl-lipoteichoic acid acyltransferase DltB (MBOAT superfamily)